MPLTPFGDKALQSSTTTTTGAYQVTTNVGAFKTIRSQIPNGGELFYYAENSDASIWEEGFGTLTYGSPDTISRTSVLQSSTGSNIDWTGVTVYIFSTWVARAIPGRYVSAKTMWVPENRKPYTAVGAGNKTVSAADVAGRFSLDNSAAARTVTLPALSTVGEGFSVEVFGLSSINYLNLAPNGSEVIDYGGAGVTLPIPGRVAVLIWSDGTQWRTDFDYSSWHTIATASASAASAVNFQSLPYWANDLDVVFEGVVVTDNVSLLMRTYGADGVLDTGASDYGYVGISCAPTPSAAAFGANTASSIVIAEAVDNSAAGIHVEVRFRNIRKTARQTKCNTECFYLNQAGTDNISRHGAGRRIENDLITGVSLFASSGNITGDARAVVRM